MATLKSDPTPAAYEFVVHPPGTLQLRQVNPATLVADEDAADEKIKELQKKLYELQVRCFLAGRRACFVFEGRDAAGKGGTIRRLTTQLDPRGYKVWPISAPKDAERRNHYLWRFFPRMPESGEIAIFDRSWYGRVLVERVEGFCTPTQWRRAFDEINAFERMHTDDGVVVRKFFLHIDRKTQLKRFKDREGDPLKRYKIGPDDWRNRAKWKEYDVAIQDMFDRTHRPDAPWLIVPANDKRWARLTILEECIATLKQAVRQPSLRGTAKSPS